MIVPPKEYSINQLGGFLLKDVWFNDNLIIDKSSYRDFSVIEVNNVIFNRVNHLSKTPYKINTEVLDFILSYGEYKNTV